MITSRAASPPLQVVAWLGGLLFVVALAYYARFFLMLGTPGPEGPSVGAKMAWNVALFSVFAAHHSLMARSGAKAWLAGVLPPELERSAYVWLASALFIAVCALWQRVPGHIYVLSPPAAWFGWALQAAGVVLTVAGGRVLDTLHLAGIRQTLAPRASSPIRLVWPFTLVRHPIYLGWVLIVFGAPVMTRDRLLWAVVSTGYLVIAIPWEERSLSAAAGPEYSAYQKQVRWRLVPGLY